MESTSDIFTLLQTSDELKELWKKIYLIHQKTKNYLLTAEEVSTAYASAVANLSK